MLSTQRISRIESEKRTSKLFLVDGEYERKFRLLLEKFSKGNCLQRYSGMMILMKRRKEICRDRIKWALIKGVAKE